MIEQTSDHNINEDEISLRELILKLREWYRYLLSKWIAIVLAGIIGGSLGLAYAWWKKPVYTAECTFVLEEDKGGGGLGQYAGLASMVGIDIGGGGGSGIFQGDNIIELYKSRSMLQKTLLSKVIIDNKPQLLIDRYILDNKLREKWADKPGLKNINFDIPQKAFTRLHDSIIGEAVKDIEKNYLTVAKPDKKLSIISVKLKAKDELFAKVFTDKIVQNVNSFYIETKTKKSAQNISILQRQADSVRRVLNSSISGVASAVDANPNPNPALQILRVPSQRRQIDVQASSAIYAEVVKNLELSKISLRRETPLIQVIDEPVLPLPKERLGKLASLMLGGISAGFLMIIILLVNLFFKWILQSDKI